MIGLFGWMRLSAAALALVAAGYGAPARVADVIAEWPTLQMPPPPTLKPAVVDTKTTGLFLFDFTNTTCSNERRPRCVEAIPNLKALMDHARGAGMLVAGQLTEAFPWDEAPDYLTRDNDRIYGEVARRRIRGMGIRDKPIAASCTLAELLCRATDRIDSA